MNRSNSGSEKKPRSLSFLKKVINTLPNPQKKHQQQRKQIIERVEKLFEERHKSEENINETEAEYCKLLENKTINEYSIFSELKEILEEDKERKDEIGPILSKLKEVLEGNRKESSIRSILSKLKEILKRTIKKEPVIKEKPIAEKRTHNTDNTNDAKEVKKDADFDEEIKIVREYMFISDNADANVRDANNYEIDVDEMLSHQNYLDDVIISDNAVVNINNLSDTKILPDVSAKNYLYDYYNFIEEFEDELYLVNYEINDEETLPPPPPYNEKDSEKDDNLIIALKKSLPSPYNEYNISELKESKDEDSSFFRTFKKIVKEVESLVDKAAMAHQAAVNKEKLRRTTTKPREVQEVVEEIVEGEDIIENDVVKVARVI